MRSRWSAGGWPRLADFPGADLPHSRSADAGVPPGGGALLARALLAEVGLSPLAALDLVRGAAVEHLRQRPLTARTLLAVLVTVPVELVAVHRQLTDNILWPPTTPGRALALIPLVLAWLPVAAEGVRRVWRHAPQATSNR